MAAARKRETITIEEAAERLGIGRTLAYRLAQHNELPVPVFRIGRRLLVSAAALDRLLEKPAANC